MATRTMKVLFPMIVVLAFAGMAGAEQGAIHVFSYSYSDTCGAVYGICNSGMNLPQAVHALRAYFARHGYDVVIREQIGHFIKADVYDGKIYVDTVVLDMMTGKMRSIY